MKVESRSNVTESRNLIPQICCCWNRRQCLYILALFGACDKRRNCDDMAQELRALRLSDNGDGELRVQHKSGTNRLNGYVADGRVG